MTISASVSVSLPCRGASSFFLYGEETYPIGFRSTFVMLPSR